MVAGVKDQVPNFITDPVNTINIAIFHTCTLKEQSTQITFRQLFKTGKM